MHDPSILANNEQLLANVSLYLYQEIFCISKYKYLSMSTFVMSKMLK